MKQLKICIVGACGKMGLAIAQEAATTFKDKLVIVSGVESRESPHVGKAIPFTVDAKVYPSGEMDLALKGVDVSIHFSSPEADLNLVPASANKGVNVVLGTTGFTPQQLQVLKDEIKGSKAAAVISPNFSPLINAQFELARKSAEMLSGLGYHFAVVEEHHAAKTDSPSGTAKRIIESVIAGGGPTKVRFWGEETGTKNSEEIDAAVLRLGGTPGQHELRVVGAHGRLTVETLMYSRADFAAGALSAAVWLAAKNAGGKESGKTFSMRDVLGFK